MSISLDVSRLLAEYDVRNKNERLFKDCLHVQTTHNLLFEFFQIWLLSFDHTITGDPNWVETVIETCNVIGKFYLDKNDVIYLSNLLDDINAYLEDLQACDNCNKEHYINAMQGIRDMISYKMKSVQNSKQILTTFTLNDLTQKSLMDYAKLLENKILEKEKQMVDIQVALRTNMNPTAVLESINQSFPPVENDAIWNVRMVELKRLLINMTRDAFQGTLDANEGAIRTTLEKCKNLRNQVVALTKDDLARVIDKAQKDCQRLADNIRKQARTGHRDELKQCEERIKSTLNILHGLIGDVLQKNNAMYSTLVGNPDTPPEIRDYVRDLQNASQLSLDAYKKLVTEIQVKSDSLFLESMRLSQQLIEDKRRLADLSTRPMEDIQTNIRDLNAFYEQYANDTSNALSPQGIQTIQSILSFAARQADKLQALQDSFAQIPTGTQRVPVHPSVKQVLKTLQTNITSSYEELVNSTRQLKQLLDEFSATDARDYRQVRLLEINKNLEANVEKVQSALQKLASELKLRYIQGQETDFIQQIASMAKTCSAQKTTLQKYLPIIQDIDSSGITMKNFQKTVADNMNLRNVVRKLNNDLEKLRSTRVPQQDVSKWKSALRECKEQLKQAQNQIQTHTAELEQIHTSQQQQLDAKIKALNVDVLKDSYEKQLQSYADTITQLQETVQTIESDLQASKMAKDKLQTFSESRLVEKDEQIHALNTQISEKDTAIRTLQSDMVERDTQHESDIYNWKQLVDTLKSSEQSTLSDLRSKLAQSEKDKVDTSATLRDTQKQLASVQRELTHALDKNVENTGRHTELQERISQLNTQLAEYRSTISTQEREIRSHQSTADMHRKEIDNLKALLKERIPSSEIKRVTEELSIQIDQYSKNTENLMDQLASSESTVDDLRKQIDASFYNMSKLDKELLGERTKSTELASEVASITEKLKHVQTELRNKKSDVSRLERENQMLSTQSSTEVSTMQAKIDGLQAQVDNLEKINRLKENTIQSNREEHARVVADLKDYYDTDKHKMRSDNSERVARLQRELDEANITIQTQASTLQDYQEKIKILKGESGSLNEGLLEKQNRIHDLTLQTQQLQRQIDGHDAQMRLFEGQRLETERTFNSLLRDKNIELGDVTNSYKQLTLEHQKLTDACRETESQLDAITQERDRIRAELDIHMHTNDSLQTLSDTHAQLQSDYDALYSEHETIKSALQDAQFALQVIQQTHDKLDVDYQTLLEIKDNIEAEYNALQDTYSQLQAEHRTLESTHEQTQTDLHTTQTQLADVQAQLVACQSEALAYSKALESVNKSRSEEKSNLSFELQALRDTLRRTESDLQHVKTQLQTVQSGFNDLQNELQASQMRVSELEGELSSHTQTIQDSGNSYNQLQDRYNEKEAELDNCKTELDNSKGKISTLEQDIVQLRSRIVQDATKYNNLYIQHTRLLAQSKEVSDVRTEKNLIIQNLEDTIRRYEKTIQQLQTSTQQLETSLRERKTDLTERDTQIKTLSDALDKCNYEKKSMESIVASTRSELQSKIQEITTLQASIADMRSIIQKAEAQEKKLQNMYKSASKDITTLSSEKKALTLTAKTNKIEIENLKASAHRADLYIHKLEEEASSYKTRIEMLQKEVQSLKDYPVVYRFIAVIKDILLYNKIFEHIINIFDYKLTSNEQMILSSFPKDSISLTYILYMLHGDIPRIPKIKEAFIVENRKKYTTDEYSVWITTKLREWVQSTET